MLVYSSLPFHQLHDNSNDKNFHMGFKYMIPLNDKGTDQLV